MERSVLVRLKVSNEHYPEEEIDTTVCETLADFGRALNQAFGSSIRLDAIIELEEVVSKRDFDRIDRRRLRLEEIVEEMSDAGRLKGVGECD